MQDLEAQSTTISEALRSKVDALDIHAGGASWGVLGASWEVFAASCGRKRHFGANLGPLEGVLGSLGPSWEVHGGVLGAS